MKMKKMLSIVLTLAMLATMIVVVPTITATAAGETVYTSANGWTLNGSEEQQDGSLAIKAGGSTPTVFTPTLTTGKKYSITFEVSGLTTDSNNSWSYPFRMKLSAGGTDIDGVLAYRGSGRWEPSNYTAYKDGTNGTLKINIDTATGEYWAYALGTLVKKGTVDNPTNISLKFYRWSDFCQAYISNVTVTDVTPLVYTHQNYWYLSDDAVESGSSFTIGKDVSRYAPTLTSGNKYEFTFDVDVPDETVGGSWKKPIHISLYSGGSSEQVIFYYLSGSWMDSNKAVTYGNAGDGTMKLTVDTATGAWEIDAPGTGSACTGTFATPVTGFGIGFFDAYESITTYPVSISNMRMSCLYTAENGWTVRASEEQWDGSLKILAGGDTATVFRPALESGKKYSITYDVTGLTSGGSDGWAYPFRMKVSAGGTDVDGALGYRMAGVWEAGSNTTTGTNGTMEVIYNTATGEWETYALGNLAKSGTFADPSDFALKFYRWSDACQAYISNVTVTDITPSIYNSANGWSMGDDATEQGTSLVLGKQDSKFTPTLTSGNKYEITFDVDVPAETVSNSWSKPAQISLYAGGTTQANVINYYLSGAWMDGSKATTYGNTGDGTMKVTIDTATGAWSIDAPGTGTLLTGSFTAPVTDFGIGLHCEQWVDPAAYPVSISNVTVTEVIPTPEPTAVPTEEPTAEPTAAPVAPTVQMGSAKGAANGSNAFYYLITVTLNDGTASAFTVKHYPDGVNESDAEVQTFTVSNMSGLTAKLISVLKDIPPTQADRTINSKSTLTYTFTSGGGGTAEDTKTTTLNQTK